MIVVRITGGLGNQMFQFSFARALQARGEKVTLQWHGHRTKSKHNGYELDNIFSKPLSEAIALTNRSPFQNSIAWTMRKTARKREPHNVGYNPEFFDIPRGYLDGYWQTEKYFSPIAETIRNDFTFKPLTGDKNLALLKTISSQPCVSMHLRRGDYLKHPGLGGICTPDYYARALEIMNEKHPGSTPIIFSDDISFCQSQFVDKNILFTGWNQGESSWMDMALMAQCSHHIIANSSFSWWGAWLGVAPNGTTIGPENWFTSNSANSNPDIYPENWISCPG